MLKKLNVRIGCTVSRQLTWPSTKKSDDTETFATSGSVDVWSVLPETRFVGSCLCVNTTWVLSVGGVLPLWQLPERCHGMASNRVWGLNFRLFLEVIF